jgi:membrane protein
VIDFIRRAVSRLRGIRVSSTSASLAFTTLLALVPLATVTLAVVARFPIFQDGLDAFEGWVVRVLMPGVGHGVVRNAIVGYAEQAARLTGLTLAFIAVTAAMLVATIEREMNLIFGVRRARPLTRRVLVYSIGVSLGPIVAGASISATTWLIGQSLVAVPMHESLARWVGQPLPWLIATVAFTLVYKIVPYTRVRWAHAATGGVLAAVAFGVREGLSGLSDSLVDQTVVVLAASGAGLAVYAGLVLAMRIPEAHQIRVLFREQFARLRG